MNRLRRAEIIAAIFCAIITFLVFLPVLRNEFVNWDDYRYIHENPFIRSINANFFERAFFHFYASNWHPLTWISHAVDYAIWGLNPMGHHLTSIILHAVNTFLVVVLVVKLMALRNRKSDPSDMSEKTRSRFTIIAAATTGLLFGLHPIHVESVAWVSERKDLLCALFFLLSILSYIYYRSYRTYKTYFLSLGFFILALLSKPMAVTLPIVLLILDFFPFDGIRSLKTLSTAFVEKIPFFALSLISSILTVLAQRAGGAISSLEKAPLSTRGLVAVKSLIAYLWKMLLPVNLMPLYRYPQNISFYSFEYLLPVILAAGITMICAVMLRKRKLWPAIWAYYVVTLIPVLGIIQVGRQAMADRYAYLPSLGPFLIPGLAAAYIYKRIQHSGKLDSIPRSLSVAAAVLLLLFTAYLTVRQIDIWKNGIVLWNYVIEKEHDGVPLAYNNRGFAFGEIGEYHKAIEDYSQAIALDPSYSEAYFHRGAAHSKMGEYDMAIEDFTKAVAIDPAYAEAYYNRGISYGGKGLFDMAIEDFDRAIFLNPKYSEAYTNRGVSYGNKGLFDKAIEDFSRAIELNPNDTGAYVNRGYAYFNTGNNTLAFSDMKKGCNMGNKKGCEMLQMYFMGTQ